MVYPSFSREIKFEAVSCFRDLGGYKTQDGHAVAWRQLFRSGEIRRTTGRDLVKLKEELKIASVIDLRNSREGIEQREEISLLNQIGAKYFCVPFNTGGDRKKERDSYDNFTDMGQVYLYRIRHRDLGVHIVEGLKIIADPANHPLIFHCVAGKDRSGLLAAIVLSILGVADKEIIEDYTLSGPHMKELFDRMSNDPRTPKDILELPAYTWEAAPESMALFLSGLRREYGSVIGYLEMHGADKSLFDRLKQALLE